MPLLCTASASAVLAFHGQLYRLSVLTHGWCLDLSGDSMGPAVVKLLGAAFWPSLEEMDLRFTES